MTRARASVPSLESRMYTTTWAVLYRMFFSREIYAVDDNELVIPWIPCRWDFRLNACSPQGERTRRDRLALLRWSPFTISSIKPVLSRSIPSRGFQLLGRTRILSTERSNDKYLCTLCRGLQDNFPWDPIKRTNTYLVQFYKKYKKNIYVLITSVKKLQYTIWLIFCFF